MISPGLRIGRYEIGKRLGKGGFGVVHVARDVDLDREIAIKVLKPEYLTRPQIVQRFIQEARAAAKIGHAGIVTVFECGQIQGTGTVDDGNAYIAMELLVGETLSERLLEAGRMAVPQAIAITRQLAAALAAAHAAGIIHRDLKPDNVFLVPDAAVHGGERVKILDFGVAKLLDPSEDGVNTHSQMMLGTPKYMSPEQARSAAKVDHRSDIYTLGCMLFEMLTGRAPFTGDSGEQLIAHQKTPPPSVRQIVSTVPPSIDALIRRMLAKSPDERPQTMTDVVDALADLADEPDTVVRAPIEATPVDAPRVSAEITTVAESAPTTTFARRRIFLAVAVGVIALSSSIAFLVMRGDRVAARSTAKVVADASIEVDAAAVVTAPDAPPVIEAPADDVVSRLRLVCAEANDAKRWPDLVACAEQLREHDAETGDRLWKLAHAEQRAEAQRRSLDAAIAERRVKAARTALDAITRDSVYWKDAEADYARLAADTMNELVVQARRASAPGCKAYDKLVARWQQTFPRELVEQVRREAPCDGGVAKAPEPAVDPAKACDFEDLLAKGQEQFSANNNAAALVHYEAAYKCGGGADALKFVFASACKAKNTAKAKVYWKRLSKNMKDSLISFCVSNGISIDVLSAP